MDYLTFTTIHTLIIVSLCGMAYLGKQCFVLMRWIAKAVWKELEEEKEKEKTG